jgi:hypothetical protein
MLRIPSKKFPGMCGRYRLNRGLGELRQHLGQLHLVTHGARITFDMQPVAFSRWPFSLAPVRQRAPPSGRLRRAEKSINCPDTASRPQNKDLLKGVDPSELFMRSEFHEPNNRSLPKVSGNCAPSDGIPVSQMDAPGKI